MRRSGASTWMAAPVTAVRPGGLDAYVDATVAGSRVAPRSRRLRRRRSRRWRRAPGEREARRHAVDDDDARHAVTAAAMMAAQPTAPAPNTARVRPGSGRRTLRTAPAPVWMPQPRGASVSEGRRPRHRDEAALVHERVPREGRLAEEVAAERSPVAGKHGALPSGRVPPKRLQGVKAWQYEGPAGAAFGALAAGGEAARARGRPAATRVTDGPTASTMPAPSWPRTPGSGKGRGRPRGEVGVTETGSDEAHEHLAGRGARRGRRSRGRTEPRPR